MECNKPILSNDILIKRIAEHKVGTENQEINYIIVFVTKKLSVSFVSTDIQLFAIESKFRGMQTTPL